MSRHAAVLAYELLVLACTAGFAAYDLRTRTVPDKALLLFCPIALMSPFLHAWAGGSAQNILPAPPTIYPFSPLPLLICALLSSAAGAATAFLILLTAAMASRDGCGVGGGDIKLAAALGFVYGPSRMAAALLAASGLAAIAALIMNHRNKKAAAKKILSLPFVPFITAGILVTSIAAALYTC